MSLPAEGSASTGEEGLIMVDFTGAMRVVGLPWRERHLPTTGTGFDAHAYAFVRPDHCRPEV